MVRMDGHEWPVRRSWRATGESQSVGVDHVDLHWIPTGAGTQIARNMKAYEWLAATLARRPRVVLCHAALKVELDGRHYTMELTPVTPHKDVIPAPVTGPVGARFAARFRIFRYQLCTVECPALPDEEWTIGEPVRVAPDGATAERIFEAAAVVPPYVWGRRVPGTTEMWTSNSVISWLLRRAGIEAANITLPAGTRAPGWRAGLEASLGAVGARPPTASPPGPTVTIGGKTRLRGEGSTEGVAMKIKVGATVITADNATLGHVAEVREGAFRVDAPRQFDYWLAENIVDEASEPEVKLLIGENDLGAYKMDHPNDTNEFQSGIPRGQEATDVAARASYEGGSRLR
jgi:hypothetical protein